MRFRPKTFVLVVGNVLLWAALYLFWHATETSRHTTSESGAQIASLPNINTATTTIQNRTSATRNETEVNRKTTPRVIDMVNDYHPYVDFKFIYPETVPDIQEMPALFLVILVNSGSKGDVYRKRRDTIRRTWGGQQTCEQSRMIDDPRVTNLQWSLVFVMGKAGEGTDDDKRNKEEAMKYNDMIIGDIEDNYLNNIVKLYMAQLWVASMMTAKYILKTDDDVYVRIPRVLEHLANEGFPNKYYGGATYFQHINRRIDRRVGGRWAISWKYYPEKTFPAFNPGAFIVLSTDLLSSLFHYVHVRKPFHTDDAYIGVAMRDLNVTVRRIKTFSVSQEGGLIDISNIIEKRSDCETLKYVAIGHDVKPQWSEFLHNRIETLCQQNISLKSCN